MTLNNCKLAIEVFSMESSLPSMEFSSMEPFHFTNSIPHSLHETIAIPHSLHETIAIPHSLHETIPGYPVAVPLVWIKHNKTQMVVTVEIELTLQKVNLPLLHDFLSVWPTPSPPYCTCFPRGDLNGPLCEFYTQVTHHITPTITITKTPNNIPMKYVQPAFTNTLNQSSVDSSQICKSTVTPT